MLLEISQNSQESTCTRVSVLMKLQAWSIFHKALIEDCFLIAEMFYSAYLLVPKQQKDSTPCNLLGIARKCHQMCSVKKGVLTNFTEFTGKHLYQSLRFNKVAGLRSFSQSTSWRLLLNSRNVLLPMSTRPGTAKIFYPV